MQAHKAVRACRQWLGKGVCVCEGGLLVADRLVEVRWSRRQ